MGVVTFHWEQFGDHVLRLGVLVAIVVWAIVVVRIIEYAIGERDAPWGPNRRGDNPWW